MNKSTQNNVIKNRAYPPKSIVKGLDNLPYNYVNKVLDVLSKKIEAGELFKTYTKRYVQKVKAGEAFNEDIIHALVEVGLENLKSQKKYQSIKNKKASSA